MRGAVKATIVGSVTLAAACAALILYRFGNGSLPFSIA